MRKLLFSTAVFLMADISANSQTVNDVPLKEIDVEYVRIIGTPRALSNKPNVDFDFGQKNKYFSGTKDTRIKDAEGKDLKFNSMIDALNYLGQYGYELVQAYAVGTTEDNKAEYYILRRKK